MTEEFLLAADYLDASYEFGCFEVAVLLCSRSARLGSRAASMESTF
jgi:hypothetical protein